MTLAAGGAGAAWLTASKFQPYLIGLSAAFIGYGFWQASRAKHCSLPRKGLNFGLLTLSALLTAGVVLFPQAIANRLTGIPQQIAATTAARIHSADAVREAFDAAPADTLKIVALYSPT